MRRLDWRFLAGTVEPRRVLCLAGGDLRHALEAVVGGLAEQAPDGTCDLAVLRNPDRLELERAFAALKPGAACYAEWSTPLQARVPAVARRLERVGFEDVVRYWPWPPPRLATPVFWLPIDSEAVISWFLRTRPRPPKKSSRMAMTAIHGVWRVLWRAGLLAPICVTARKPSLLPTSDSEHPGTLPATLARDPAAWGLDGGAESVACLLLTGGSSVRNKVVALAFAADESDPHVALKLPRLPGAEASLRREASVLRALHAGRPLTGIPQVLAERKFAGRIAVAETVIVGRPITDVLEPQTYPGIAANVTSLVADLAAAGGSRRPADRWNRLVEPSLAALEPAERPLGREILAAVGELPEVWEHRDCSPWNLLLQPDGRLALLDWESAERGGLPGLDLVYFLAYASFFVEGTMDTGNEATSYAAMLDPGTLTGRVYAECTSQYARRVGVATDQLERLRLLCWLSQARSAQLRGDPSGSLAALFLTLARIELARR